MFIKGKAAMGIKYKKKSYALIKSKSNIRGNIKHRLCIELGRGLQKVMDVIWKALWKNIMSSMKRWM